jgi:dsRNA-specific ribonuclease
MKLSKIRINGLRGYATRSGKANRGLPMIGDEEKFKELPTLPVETNLKIYQDLNNLLQEKTDKVLSQVDLMKRDFQILSYQNVLIPHPLDSRFSYLYKDFTAPNKTFTTKLQDFNQQTIKIDDKRAFYSLFLHTSVCDGPHKNKPDIAHQRLAHFGQTILNFNVSAFLLTNLDLDQKLKQSLIDITWDGTLYHVANKLGYEDLILISPTIEKFPRRKFIVDSMLGLIALGYLSHGITSSSEFISNTILPLMIECHKDVRVKYVDLLSTTFVDKFNVYPRWETMHDDGKVAIVSVYAYNKYMGCSEGENVEMAKENVAKLVYNDMTRADFAKDPYLY